MKHLLSSIATLALTAGLAQGQAANVPDNLDKLSNFQTTGVTEFTFIEQGGDYAEGIKATLDKITLPEGFKIDLYAVVPDARHMAVGPQGIVTFVGTRKDKVWSVTDRNKDRVADEVKDFAPSLQPHRAGLRYRAGWQDLHLAWPALQRGPGGPAGEVQEMGHRRHHPDEHRRHRPRGLHLWRAQLGRAGFPSRNR
jgi:hypothetical protein